MKTTSKDERSTIILAATAAIFFFTTSLSSTFLPVYFAEDLGMSVPEITVILLFTFLVTGLVPILFMKTTRHFERVISLGIIMTLVFYLALVFIRNPVLLGLAYGVSLATFWPSFNLLQFRLSETKERAFLISLLSVAIPGVVGIASPAVGGYVIETWGFVSLYAVSIALFLVAFVVSLKIRFKPEVQRFVIPKGNMLKLFMITFVLLALSESYWLAYPLFVLSVSSTVISMGLVVTASSLIITLANLAINRLSDIKRARIEFAIASSILYAVWYFALAQASSMIQLVALSPLTGLAGAFALSWFAYYGDSYGREYHASILVLMEVGFMVGRILNLIPTYFLVTGSGYSEYFTVLGLVSLLPAPLYLLSRKRGNE